MSLVYGAAVSDPVGAGPRDDPLRLQQEFVSRLALPVRALSSWAHCHLLA